MSETASVGRTAPASRSRPTATNRPGSARRSGRSGSARPGSTASQSAPRSVTNRKDPFSDPSYVPRTPGYDHSRRDTTIISPEARTEDDKDRVPEALLRSLESSATPVPTDKIADSPFKNDHELVRRLLHGESPTDRPIRDRPVEAIMKDMMTARAPLDEASFKDKTHLEAEMAHASGRPFLDEERTSTMMLRSPAYGRTPEADSYVHDLIMLSARVRGSGSVP